MSAMFGTTALGVVIPSVFLGKEGYMGKATEKGRKLKAMRSMIVPGTDVPLGDLATIASNEAGFFNAVVHSDLWIDGTLRRHIEAEELHDRAAALVVVGIWMDDATGIHKGETKEGGKLLPGSRNSVEYLTERLRQVEVGVPGGFTSFRPQDQREINYLVQWKYVTYLEEIVGIADFRPL
jgi:hypothetical protein